MNDYRPPIALKSIRFYHWTDPEFSELKHMSPCVDCGKLVNIEYCLDQWFGVVLCDEHQRELCDWIATRHRR